MKRQFPLVRFLAAVAVAAATNAWAAPASAQIGTTGVSTTGAYLAARTASYRYDLAAAAQYYRVVFDRNPGDLPLASAILSLWVEAGEVDRAEAVAEAIIAIDPGYEPARLVLATIAFANGEFARAGVQVSAVTGDALAQAATDVLSAWAEVGRGNLDAALEILAGPNAGLFGAFHASLIADLDGRSEEAVALMETVYAPQSSQRMTEAYARQLARVGRTEDAVGVLSFYLSALPGHPTLTQLLADIEAGEPIEPMIETARQGAAELFYGVGSSLVAGEELDTAIIYLRLAQHIGQNTDFGILLLGQILQSQRRFEEAAGVFDAIPADSPLFITAAVSASISDEIRGETEAASARLEPVIAANPDNLDAGATLADIYRTQGRFEDAEVVLTGVIGSLGTFIPDDWLLFFGRGISYERTGRWEQAEADFRQALALVPDQPDVLNYLGYTLVVRGENLDEAFEMIERAVEQRPESGHIVDSLGWAYYSLGDYETAVPILERAVELVPYQPEILDHLGDAYWRVGRRLEAVYQWNHTLFFDPEPEFAQAVQDKIDNGLPDIEEGAPEGGVLEIR
jgi:tetratricopeptide (TPR) repeat protein